MKHTGPAIKNGVTVCENHAKYLNDGYVNNMYEANLEDWYDWFYLHMDVPDNIYDNMKAMLNSPDKENRNIAIELIKIKQEEWNLNLQQKTTSTKV